MKNLNIIINTNQEIDTNDEKILKNPKELNDFIKSNIEYPTIFFGKPKDSYSFKIINIKNNIIFYTSKFSLLNRNIKESSKIITDIENNEYKQIFEINYHWNWNN